MRFLPRVLILALVLPILALTQAHAQNDYTIQLTRCLTFGSLRADGLVMSCDKAQVTDSTETVFEEKITLLFYHNGSVNLQSFNADGTPGPTYSVDPSTGNFSDANGVLGNISYSFIVTHGRGYKNSITTTTYVVGTISDTPLVAGPGMPAPIPPQPNCPGGGDPNCCDGHGCHDHGWKVRS